MGSRLHGRVLVCDCGRQIHIRVCCCSAWSETSIWRDCPQLKLRVPELPSRPEERMLSALQGQVDDSNAQLVACPVFNGRFGTLRPTVESLITLDRFTHYVTRSSLHLFINACQVFANDTQADHQQAADNQLQENDSRETGKRRPASFR